MSPSRGLNMPTNDVSQSCAALEQLMRKAGNLT